LDWYRHGLNPPPSVISAGAEWQRDSDPVGQFLSNRCDVSNPDVEIGFGVLYAAYQEWCSVSGFDPWSQKAFSLALKGKGFNKRESNGKTLWKGLALLPENQ
jgi:putative DNA primase/helicase